MVRSKRIDQSKSPRIDTGWNQSSAIAGSYGAQRRLATVDADEQVALVEQGNAPELKKVYRFALGALTSAVDLAKISRS